MTSARHRRAAIAAVAVAGVAVIIGVAASWIFPSTARPAKHDAAHSAPEAAHAAAHSDDDAPEGPLDPSFFAPGACVAYAPTSGDNGKTVFLDAGHGGLDPGGTGETSNGTQISEAPINLSIELLTAAILRAHGYRVVVSRSGSSGVARLGSGDVDGNMLTTTGAHADVADRDICANKAHADLLAGIYMDAGDAEGSLTAYDPDRSFSASNLRFATLLQGDVLSKLNGDGLGIPDDGVVSDVGLGSSLDAADMAYDHLLLLGPAEQGFFSTPSQMPGALIEPLYLTDPFEASVAVSASGQRLIAAGIAEAVEQYFA